MFLHRNKQTNKQFDWLTNRVHGKEQHSWSSSAFTVTWPTHPLNWPWAVEPISPRFVLVAIPVPSRFFSSLCNPNFWQKTTSSNLFLHLRRHIKRKENEWKDQRFIHIETLLTSAISFKPWPLSCRNLAPCTQFINRAWPWPPTPFSAGVDDG